MNSEVKTYFASPERAEIDEIMRQKYIFDNFAQLSYFLNAIHNMYLILNEHRQIVFANQTALDTFGYKSMDEILGMRPGEAIKCIHATEMPAGCGTSEACQHCGAVNAILTGLKNTKDVRECRINTEDAQNVFDLRVWTNPYKIGDEMFVIFSVADISDEKRRRALERIFFHDVLNTAGGIKGISELIQNFPEEITEFNDILFDSSNQLLNEILAQRDLVNAENSELLPYITKLNSKRIVDFLVGFYSNHEISKDKTIVVQCDDNGIEFESDEALLLRVLGNMTKNALEASPKGQTVTISCIGENDKVVFSVHNTNFMPREVQLQVFQRSFTTKGIGRGLGTYSMKLLSEKYLNGKVYFTTDESSGTTFYGEYPIRTGE
jgi:signal transduction histidine kinase